MGKASTRATNKYHLKAYDRINFVVKKGSKDIIKQAAEAAGESMNEYIKTAVDMRMEREEK